MTSTEGKDEIVTRLREFRSGGYFAKDLMNEAADRIVFLQSELDVARKALPPAPVASWFANNSKDGCTIAFETKERCAAFMEWVRERQPG